MSDVDDLLELPGGKEIVADNEEVEFTPEEEIQFVELFQIGKKQKPITFYGHTAIISTLTNEEEIALGFALEKYQKLPTMSRAYKTCVVAASLREVDGNSIYTPLGNTEVADVIRAKYKIVTEYSPIVIDKIYDEIAKLMDEVVNLWEKLGKESS